MLVKNWDIHYFDEVESTNLIVKERIKRDGPLAQRKSLRQHESSNPIAIFTSFPRNSDFSHPQTPRKTHSSKIAHCSPRVVSSPCVTPGSDGPCGFVAVAKSQSGGRGMRGHSWESPEGGLYFSIALDTHLSPSELPEIPKRIASVVMSVLQPLSSETLTIKPPNDIVLSRSYCEEPSSFSCSENGVRHACCIEKLVGISSEIYLEKLCIGIGINVFRPKKEIEVAGENIPVYLNDFSNQELSLDFVLKTVLDALNDKLVL